MWVVAELDDDYIARMEDVLEVYERPYDAQQPVICLDPSSRFKPTAFQAVRFQRSPTKMGTWLWTAPLA